MRFLLRRNDKKNKTKRKLCLSEVFLSFRRRRKHIKCVTKSKNKLCDSSCVGMTKKTKQNAKFVFPRYFCHSDEGGITSSKPKTKRKLCLSEVFLSFRRRRKHIKYVTQSKNKLCDSSCVGMTKKTEQNTNFVFPRYFCHSDEGGITSSKPKTKRKLCLSDAGGNTTSIDNK